MSQTMPTGEPNAGGDTVEASYAAGQQALERGDLDAARELAARCAAAPGGDTDARCARLSAAIASEDGDFEGAAATLRQALERAPADATLVRLLGEALSANGQLAEAATALEDGARQNPGSADVLLDLGFARAALGDSAGALDALERAAAANPNDASVQRALANMYEAAGRAEAAAKTYAALGDELGPAGVISLARLYLRLGQYREAERAFRRLARLTPDDQLVAEHGMIWCNLKQGDWRGAFNVALGATRLDRYGLTTSFLAYAKDRLFGQVPDAAGREAELEQRLLDEVREQYELYSTATAGGRSELLTPASVTGEE